MKAITGLKKNRRARPRVPQQARETLDESIESARCRGTQAHRTEPRASMERFIAGPAQPRRVERHDFLPLAVSSISLRAFRAAALAHPRRIRFADPMRRFPETRVTENGTQISKRPKSWPRWRKIRSGIRAAQSARMAQAGSLEAR